MAGSETSLEELNEYLHFNEIRSMDTWEFMCPKDRVSRPPKSALKLAQQFMRETHICNV